jgi:Tfp pilus assembly protein PilV
MSAIVNRLRAESGSIMVEVLVGCILLALTTAAVLDGVDGAQETGRKNRDRSAAATLAQQDLERMRSMPPTVLNGLDQTRTVTVANVPYTVVSRTAWVSDASGLASCTSSNTQAEYLKLTSTVNSPASADTPVSAASLLTPPPGALGVNKGTVAVKLTDRDGQPLEGVAVELDGPGSEIGTTNDVGCAIFAYITAGNWTAEVDAGLVSWTGTSPATSSVTVAADKTSLTQIELDTPASLRASFITSSGVATQSKSMSVANSKLPNGYKEYSWSPASGVRDVENLFPFHDGYGVFAGTCEANNPAAWDSDYFQTAGFGFVALDPGELLGSVQVVMPELHVTVRRMDGSTPTTFAEARIHVKERDSALDCTAVMSNLQVTGGSSTSYTFDLVLPFGNYEVCAAARGSSSGTWRRKFTGNSGLPAHRNLTPLALLGLNQSITMDVPSSGGTSEGQCNSLPPT